jgi:hypothetical protein
MTLWFTYIFIVDISVYQSDLIYTETEENENKMFCNNRCKCLLLSLYNKNSPNLLIDSPSINKSATKKHTTFLPIKN